MQWWWGGDGHGDGGVDTMSSLYPDLLSSLRCPGSLVLVTGRGGVRKGVLPNEWLGFGDQNDTSSETKKHHTWLFNSYEGSTLFQMECCCLRSGIPIANSVVSIKKS